MPRFRRSLVLLALAAWLSPSPPARDALNSRDEPLRVEGSDHIEVRRVLLDVLVLDRRGRTVPDLSIEDFRVVIDGRAVAPETLDVRCAAGQTPDPVNGARFDPQPLAGGEGEARKFVLVFDYFHMKSAKETLEQAREAIERLRIGGEEHMIAVVGESVRVELPFTGDRGRVAATLERMVRDPSLYAGNYGRLTERRFYERLLTLFDLMELEPGRKVMVLFSGPFLPDGWNHDVYYRQLAAMASRTRTSVYPIDTRGLEGAIPAKLARIATATGGRMTGRTNDLGLAYARAQRDLSCTYTLGLRDGNPGRRNRRVNVYVEKRGASVVHANGYALRSQRQQLESMTHTAGMAPGMFDDGGMTAELFVVEPSSARRWSMTLSVAIPRETLEADLLPGPWIAGGKIRKRSGTLVHRFRRQLAPEESMFHETFKLASGDYDANLWLFREGMDRPLALAVPFQVPEVPDDGPLLESGLRPAIYRLEALALSAAGAAGRAELPFEIVDP